MNQSKGLEVTNSSAVRTERGPKAKFHEALHVGRPNIGDKATFLRYVDEIFDRRWITNDGPLVKELERDLADKLGVRHCIAVTNGTIALELAIRALDMTGEVIVPSFTFVATAHSLQWQGVTPVFVDIDPDSHNIDPVAVEKAITGATTGILAVHLWGRPAPIRELTAIADRAGLKLLFDAAHAFGNSYEGTMIGNFGDAEVFSFHATKFFNTFEGGAVATNNDALAEKIRLMRNFGFAGEDNVIYPGTNGKMVEVCAAMGLTNLKSLDFVVETNRNNYHDYCAQIEAIPGLSILPVDEMSQSNHQYVVMIVAENCALSRDRILHELRANNVLARRYFWPGVHRMAPYNALYPHYEGALPVTEKVAEQIIVLPTGTAVDSASIRIIGEIIRGIVEEQGVNR